MWLPLAGEKWIESPPAITFFDSLHVRFNMVNKELLQDIFSYDNGNLYWKTIKSKKVKAGQKAGSVDRYGYMRTQVLNKTCQIHRLVWIFHYGNIEDNYTIDHIDRNTLNNKIENLRIATRSQNSQNTGKKPNNTSGYKNVYWSKEKQKWLVSCISQGKKRCGGSYAFIDDAVKAAILLRKKFHQEFAQDDITC